MAMLLSRESCAASQQAKAPLINNKMYVYVARDVFKLFFSLTFSACIKCTLYCIFWNLSIYINNLSSSFHLNCFFLLEGMHMLKTHFRHVVADSQRKSYLSGLNPLRRWSVMNIESEACCGRIDEVYTLKAQVWQQFSNILRLQGEKIKQRCFKIKTKNKLYLGAVRNS